MAPRVTVVVPTRNRLAQLQRALACVERQSYRDFKVIVVDDGSTDGTRAWLERPAATLRALSTASSGGASAARNLAIQHSRGELIAFLDDDDVWQPSYLEAQVHNLDANTNAVLSYAEYVEIHATGEVSLPDTRAIMGYHSLLIRMLAEAFIHTMSAVVCRRAAFDRHGLFSETWHIIHDWEWYARLLVSGEQFVHLDRQLVGRAVPGGLVTRHRDWYAEEQRLLDTTLRMAAVTSRDARLVRSYRSLFFARLALARGDIAFGVRRLVDAFVTSPPSALSVTTRRLLRRLQLADAHPATSWDAPVSATR